MKCLSCKGTGKIRGPMTGEKRCIACKGTGEVSDIRETKD